MNSRFIFFILMLLMFTNCMSYVGFDDIKLLGKVSRVFMLFLVPLTIVMWNRFPKTTLVRCAFLLMTFQLLSIVGAYAVHNQGFMDSFVVTSYALVYLVFPFMYVLNIKEETLKKLFIVIGIWWAFTMLIQQFTYPTYWFCNAQYHEEGVGMRNGVYRFGIAGTTYGLLMLFYALQRYMDKPKFVYLILMAIGIMGVYLTCTRQIMAASAGCILVGMWLKGKIKIGALIGIAVIGLLIYRYSDALFGEYVEMTESVDKDYIRFISYEFYGLEYNKGNPIAILLGNGIARGTTAYGHEMENYMKGYGLNQSDIGLVGEYSLHGIIYVFVILYIFWYVFKNRKYIDLYLQLYMLYVCVTSVMLLHFRCSLGTFGTCVVLYMIDRCITRKKRAIRDAYINRRQSLTNNDLQHPHTRIQADVPQGVH